MITERAMLAAVHISIWTAVKHDRKVSRDVADQHGAHQGAGPITSIPAAWAERGETIIRTTFKQSTGGATEKRVRAGCDDDLEL
jgi:hypothetical protein